MPEINRRYQEKPTEKQLQFISVIEDKLNIQFNGETRKDAAIFIQKNYSVIKKKRDMLRHMWRD